MGYDIWTAEQDSPWVDIVCAWEIRAARPLSRCGLPVLQPIVAANHRWTMASGEESPRLEVRRRGR